MFSWEVDADGRPMTVTCPGNQPAVVRAARKALRFVAYFEQSGCSTCPFAEGCPARPMKRRATRSLKVSLRQIQVALLRQRAARTRGKGNNWRAAIESTVRSITHPFGGQSGKLPVRGQIRVTHVLICSALMVNVRRIWRHEQQMAQKKSQKAASLLSRYCWLLRSWLHMLKFYHFSGFAPASLGM